MNFDLPALPYPKSALAPFISVETMAFHHNKHEWGYLDTLRQLLEGTPEAELPLEQIVSNHQRSVVMRGQTVGARRRSLSIIDNGLQVLNHEFFWRSMKPVDVLARDAPAQGETRPSEYMKAALEAEFGSYEQFLTQFEEASVSTAAFGSSWLWLVVDHEPNRLNRLEIVATQNAGRPSGLRTPLLVCDLWEHAYYIDYRNERRIFARAFLQRLANWDFAEQNLRNAH